MCWQLPVLLHSIVPDPPRYSSLPVVQSVLELVASKHSTAAPPSKTRHRLRSSRPWQLRLCSTQVSPLPARPSRSAANSLSTRSFTSRLASLIAVVSTLDYCSALAEAARNRVRSAPLEFTRHLPNVSCCTPAVELWSTSRCACRALRVAPTLRGEGVSQESNRRLYWGKEPMQSVDLADLAAFLSRPRWQTWRQDVPVL